MTQRARIRCFITGNAQHVLPSKRVVHHAYGMLMGCVFIFGGAYMAVDAPVLLAMMPIHIPHTVWEGVAYSLHGFGLIPIVGHGDKLYKKIMEPEGAQQ